MGGRIWAESRKGQGSRFQFTVPFKCRPVEKACPDVIPKDLHNLKTLVMEDSNTARVILREERTVGKGHEASGHIKGAHVLLVEDNAVNQPVARETLNTAPLHMHVKKNDLPHEIPIIAMTAHAMKGDRERCIAEGMNDYVTKPIDIDRLFTVLERWIHRDDQGMSAYESPLEK